MTTVTTGYVLACVYDIGILKQEEYEAENMGSGWGGGGKSVIYLPQSRHY